MSLAPVLPGDPVEVALALTLITTLVAVTRTDLEQRLIPNRILAASAVTGLALVALGDPSSLAERLGAAAGAGGLLLLAAVAYPEGMGMGDVKLSAVIGVYLGPSVMPALLIAFTLGVLFGLVLVARHGLAARKQAIPFGPFLAAGGLIGLLAGRELIGIYLGTFS